MPSCFREREACFAILPGWIAGKTTFIRTIATLLRPDAGTLRVGGVDVTENPKQVRRSIGLAGQFAAVEPALTGRENLRMVARLFGHDRRAGNAAADEVLEAAGCEVQVARAGPRGAVLERYSVRSQTCRPVNATSWTSWDAPAGGSTGAANVSPSRMSCEMACCANASTSATTSAGGS